MNLQLTIAALFLSVAGVAQCQTQQASPQIADIAAYISKTARLLGVESAPREFDQIAEVVALRSSERAIRIGQLAAALDYLDDVEQRIFQNSQKNEGQITTLSVVRIGVLTQLRKLIVIEKMTIDDLVLQDSVDSDIADLNFVVAQRIPFGRYRLGKQERDSKRIAILTQKQEIIRAYLEARAKQNSSSITLVNKLFMVSMLSACSRYAEACQAASK